MQIFFLNGLQWAYFLIERFATHFENNLNEKNKVNNKLYKFCVSFQIIKIYCLLFSDRNKTSMHWKIWRTNIFLNSFKKQELMRRNKKSTRAHCSSAYCIQITNSSVRTSPIFDMLPQLIQLNYFICSPGMGESKENFWELAILWKLW